MPTPASQQALVGLRDLSMLEWYVIPLLAIVFYIYTSEMKKARQTGYWDAVFAGLTVFGMKTNKSKVITIASLYGIAIVANVFAMGILGWRY